MKHRTYLILLLLLFTACGRGNKDEPDTGSQLPSLIGGGSGAGLYEEISGSVPIRLMVPGTAMDSDAMAIELANRFRLSITFYSYPTNYDEMMRVLSSADYRPDMFLLALNPARMHQLVSEGIIRGIPDAMIENFPGLAQVINQNPIAQANLRLYGAVGYIPCVYDNDPKYAADSGRLFYRKDWADILNLQTFGTTDGIYHAARTFANETNPNRPDSEAGLIGIAVDKPERFAYMYGLDPAGWIQENDRYIPAFYSERMMQPLTFARQLYSEGLMVFNNGRITLNDAGILLASAGSPQELDNVLAPVARSLRTTTQEVLDRNVVIMAPPRAAGANATWGRNYRPEGWLAQESLPDFVLMRFMDLLEYSLSEEGRSYARYGIENETYLRDNNHIYLFTDPNTFRAYDLPALYPTGQFLLRLLNRDVSRDADIFYPSTIPLTVRMSAAEATAQYFFPIETTDALCRAVHSTHFIISEFDYNAYFYNIITGEEPIADMFARFKYECLQFGIEDMITEVNQAAARR